MTVPGSTFPLMTSVPQQRAPEQPPSQVPTQRASVDPRMVALVQWLQVQQSPQTLQNPSTRDHYAPGNLAPSVGPSTMAPGPVLAKQAPAKGVEQASAQRPLQGDPNGDFGQMSPEELRQTAKKVVWQETLIGVAGSTLAGTILGLIFPMGMKRWKAALITAPMFGLTALAFNYFSIKSAVERRMGIKL